MFRIDHIMIETTNPLESANTVKERFALPFAWPLLEADDYSSVGINFGALNFEFIDFRRRFGIAGKSFSGLSGLAFKTGFSVADSLSRLENLGFRARIGEKARTHTTITVEEDRVFPTIFLVKYHFDTSGWQARLNKEFQECGGGRFRIASLRSVMINRRLPPVLATEFEVDGSESETSRIHFRTARVGDEPVVVSDLIPNLEIVIAD